eukprot:TRINITY_DN6377_c0_g1_i4.p1 TRINITY_DN6377_c0_g1~~TRINITY_DN6377_c0_g1_i4.p1  ORF type:complete len:210 (-),score=23.15 TRINITY_DN6377_c0_g1_i4:53-682(-)
MKIKGSKIRTTVDIKYLGKPVLVEEDLTIESNIDQYIYRVSCNDINYILKGYKALLTTGYDTEKSSFAEELKKMERMYEGYFFMKAISSYSPYFAKPLFLDSAIELKAEKTSMHIKCLYEHSGTILKNIYDTEHVKFKDTFNFMGQSANALAILHSIGVIDCAITPFNMTHDKERDKLKIFDIKSNTVSSLHTDIPCTCLLYTSPSPRD